MTIAKIKCNRIDYMLPESVHAGSSLYAFFGVKTSENLWGECDKGDSLIPNDESEVMVEDGMRFHTASKKINNG
jgi:hypothetical protein